MSTQYLRPIVGKQGTLKKRMDVRWTQDGSRWIVSWNRPNKQMTIDLYKMDGVQNDDVMIIILPSLHSNKYPPCYTSPVFPVMTLTLTFIRSQADPVTAVQLDISISTPEEDAINCPHHSSRTKSFQNLAASFSSTLNPTVLGPRYVLSTRFVDDCYELSWLLW